MTEVKCETCGEAEAIREIGAQWCHEAGVQEARAAAAEARITVLESGLRHFWHLLAPPLTPERKRKHENHG
jgi:hypothetical protein